MKLSIIGSEGYIGTAFRLHPQLVQLPVDIQRIDACLYDQPRVHVCYVRFNDLPSILSYLTHFNPDVVLNLAALAHDPEGKLDPMSVDYANMLMPQQVANWCLERQKRFVTISSLSIHGQGAYPMSKRKMEEAMFKLGIPRGIDIVRFGTIFGVVPDLPWRHMRPHLLLNSMALDACLHGAIRVNGAMQRPCTALHDAVDCLFHLVFERRAPGQVLNRYTASASLCEWAYEVKHVIDEMEGTNVQIKSGTSVDNRSYFFPPHVNEVPGRALQDTLKELIRYTRTYLYPLARWRKIQLRVLQGKMRSPIA